MLEDKYSYTVFIFFVLTLKALIQLYIAILIMRRQIFHQAHLESILRILSTASQEKPIFVCDQSRGTALDQALSVNISDVKPSISVLRNRYYIDSAIFQCQNRAVNNKLTIPKINIIMIISKSQYQISISKVNIKLTKPQSQYQKIQYYIEKCQKLILY